MTSKSVYNAETFINMANESTIFKELEEDLKTIKRHISIIQTLMKEQPAGIIRISNETGIPQHKIRYSLRILENDGLISPSKEGAILTPKFIENRDQIAEEARKLSDDMSELYKGLKATLIKR